MNILQIGFHSPLHPLNPANPISPLNPINSGRHYGGAIVNISEIGFYICVGFTLFFSYGMFKNMVWEATKSLYWRVFGFFVVLGINFAFNVSYRSSRRANH